VPPSIRRSRAAHKRTLGRGLSGGRAQAHNAEMQIENSFAVGASPDTVFAFLLDVNRIVGCVPGAELSEVVDPDTFRGRVRIKVGPVTVAYNGTAHITERDEQARRATLQAEGRETTGSGSARATTTMSVAPDGAGSAVHFATDFTVVGRVAQFGRGIMEEVSRKLVGQMAECIRTKLEAEGAAAPAAETPSANGKAKDEGAGSPRARGASPRKPRASAKPAAEPSIAVTGAAAATEAAPNPAAAEPLSTAAPAAAASGAAPISGGPAATAIPATPPGRVQLATEPSEAAVPLDALALARSIAADRIKAVGPGRLAGLAVALFAVFALGRWLRGRSAKGG